MIRQGAAVTEPTAPAPRRPVVTAAPATDPSADNTWVLAAFTAITNLTDGVTKVGLPLIAASLTGSAALVSGVLLALSLPWLVAALHIGVLVDRADAERAHREPVVRAPPGDVRQRVLDLRHGSPAGGDRERLGGRRRRLPRRRHAAVFLGIDSAGRRAAGALAQLFGYRVAFGFFAVLSMTVIVPFLRIFTPNALAGQGPGTHTP